MRTSLVVVATLILDAVFFALNAAVFSQGGSHAVFSQAVTAATDLAGSLMILWGQRAAQLPATPKHPFGRGKERFFWAYSAGLVTFAVAGALVFYQGVQQATSPHPVSDLAVGIGAVAATLGASLASLVVVLLELRRDRQSIQSLLASTHQGVKTVFLQDVVSVVGAGVALVGLYVVRATGLVMVDGIAAAIVGLLLLLAGFTLAGEGRELLVGRAVGDEEGRAILSLVERYPFVRQVMGMQSMMLGPEDRLVALRVNFMDEMDTDDIEMHIDQLRRFVRGEFPVVQHLLIEPVRAAGEEHPPPAQAPGTSALRSAAAGEVTAPKGAPPAPGTEIELRSRIRSPGRAVTGGGSGGGSTP